MILTVTLIIRRADQLDQHLQRKDQKEWLIFLTQFENEVAGSTLFDIQRKQFRYVIENKTYIIEQYQSIVRKRQTAGGHQPMLMNVDEFSFEERDNEVILEVTFENGERGYGKWAKP
ncbi:competence type IV pilus minor pilin ComGF [Candidatus Enterococcus courvalinii]|uniref:competence type IV pilus minor pilin ComGF n=1 Tax=Candidatus Enterococcus courvalinii TaxID=2815329 RepID=UPI0032420E97